MMTQKYQPVPSHLFVSFPQDISEIGKRLECITCSTISDPQEAVMVCKHKHFICMACSKSDGGSGLTFACGCSPSDLEKTDNRHLAEFFKASFWHCRYRTFGCQELIIGKQYLSHKEACGFKPTFKCHYKKCTAATINLKTTVDHIIQIHGDKVTQVGQSGEISLELDIPVGGEDQFGLFKYREKYFILAIQIVDDEMHFWVWDPQVMDHGAPSKLKYALTIMPLTKSENYNKSKEIGFSGMCVPYPKSISNVIKDGDCLVLSVKHLRKNHMDKVFQRQHERFAWILKIKLQVTENAGRIRHSENNARESVRKKIDRLLLK